MRWLPPSAKRNPTSSSRRTWRPRPGIILPDELPARRRRRRSATSGGLFVLDCIASGAVWVDMDAAGVDVSDQRPAKGLERAALLRAGRAERRARRENRATTSTSFACDLKKWLQIMEAYEGGGMPTTRPCRPTRSQRLRDVMLEAEQYGFERLAQQQTELGRPGARTARSAAVFRALRPTASRRRAWW